MSSVSAILSFFMVLTKCYTAFNFLVSLPIYVSLLHFLVRNRRQEPYNSSFFLLFTALGFCDICAFVNYTLKKCSFWDWVPGWFYPLDEPNRAANFHFYWVYVGFFAQDQLNLLLSFNRFVSILFPWFYTRHWTRRLTGWLVGAVLGIALVLPLPFHWAPIGIRTTTIELGNNQTIVKLTGPVFMDTGTQTLYYNLMVVFLCAELLFTLVSTPLMYRRVRQLNTNDKQQAIEVKLFYALLFMLLFHVPFAAYFTTWLFLSSNLQLAHQFEWALYVVDDMYSMATPYGLLLMSRVLRESVFPFCLFKKSTSITTSVPVLTGKVHPLSINNFNKSPPNEQQNNQQRSSVHHVHIALTRNRPDQATP